MPTDERKILDMCARRRSFDLRGHHYEIREYGKPMPARGRGEPKTDVYIAYERDGEPREMRLSHKRENADFVENKLAPWRAEQVFGEGWRGRVAGIVESLMPQIARFPTRKAIPGGDALLLGLRLDILNKPSSAITVNLNATREERLELVTGGNMSARLRDAVVNGRVVEGSGVANAVLCRTIRPGDSIEDVFLNAVTAAAYADGLDAWAALKAVNYRRAGGKPGYEGRRPLAVMVGWSLGADGRIVPKLLTDRPLEYTSTDAAGRLEEALGEWGRHGGRHAGLEHGDGAARLPEFAYKFVNC